MVSTLGAVTGIAIGSQDHFMVVMAGMVIIAVESISMGVGSYLSNRSQQDLHHRVLHEEREEIKDYPHEEQHELNRMFIRDGWPPHLAEHMTEVAAKDRHLMLQEMAYRELNIAGTSHGTPIRNGIYMFIAYVVGGMVPLLAYLLMSVSQAMPISIVVTLLGLFGLGAATTRLTKGGWFRSGLRIMILGGLAMVIGLVVGNFAKDLK